MKREHATLRLQTEKTAASDRIPAAGMGLKAALCSEHQRTALWR